MTDSIDEYINKAPTPTIYDGFIKAISVLKTHHNIVVSVSGGSDSDNMVEIMEHIRNRNDGTEVNYVWFNTGIEMDATKRHLDYLEDKYNVKIIRVKPKITVPAAVIQRGYPFLSKFFSGHINDLQEFNFDWNTDKTLDELVEKFPDYERPLKWWYGKYKYSVPKLLKKFMQENPPDFRISSKCCYCAKKEPAKEICEELNADLSWVGIRRAEGGVRAFKQSCFDPAGSLYKFDRYYPCFWWTNEDKAAFEKTYGVVHSDAYTVYGFERTGCAGCPFNIHSENDSKILHQYEPKLANAVERIFAPSNEYTHKFLKYREENQETK